MEQAERDAKMEQVLRYFMEISPFANHLGLELVWARDGEVEVAADIQPFHANTQGIAHGGLVCSLADQAGPLAVATRLKKGQILRTVQLDVHYLAPGKCSRIIARGKAVKTGGRIAVADVEVVDENGKALAVARVLCAVVDVPGDGTKPAIFQE
ncbi:MAG: PaaI family thioesterase [Desulfatibacillaceae bacterium]